MLDVEGGRSLLLLMIEDGVIRLANVRKVVEYVVVGIRPERDSLGGLLGTPHIPVAAPVCIMHLRSYRRSVCPRTT